MTRGRSTRQQRARLLLSAVVGGIVFGIVGMHSLSLPHSGPTATAQSSATAPVHAMGAGVVHAGTLGGEGHQGHQPAGHDDDCGLIACCLAAMFGGALLFWAVFVAHQRRRVAWIKRLSITIRVQVKSVLRPPPDLISLSILRC
jgi:hypothetical protein